MIKNSDDHSEIINRFISSCEQFLKNFSDPTSKERVLRELAIGNSDLQESYQKLSPFDKASIATIDKFKNLKPTDIFNLFLSNRLNLFIKDLRKETTTKTDDEKLYKPPNLTNLFHSFIVFYFKTRKKFDKLSIEFDLSWIRHLFENKYGMYFFKIPMKTIELLIESLLNNIIDYQWLDLPDLQSYFSQCPKDDFNFSKQLKTLIYMGIKRRDCDFHDIKYESKFKKGN